MDLVVELHESPDIQGCKRRRVIASSDHISHGPRANVTIGMEHFTSSQDEWFTLDPPEMTPIEVVGLTSFDISSGAKIDPIADGIDAIIFADWDDTILPTTWLQKQGLQLGDKCLRSATQRECLEAVAVSALGAIRVAKKLGKLVIVTMADAGWVELTCCHFLPLLGPVLEDVTILSAKSKFQHADVNASPAELKRMAFEHEMRKLLHSGTEFKHVLSIGDSQHERDALHGSTIGVPNTYAKSVKLIPRPTVNELAQEHKYLTDKLPALVAHMGDFDVLVKLHERQPNESP